MCEHSNYGLQNMSDFFSIFREPGHYDKKSVQPWFCVIS